MPIKGNFLLGIDLCGELFKLSLETLECSHVENSNANRRRDAFKRIVTAPTCAWGIRVDQRVYLYKFETDLPIRVQEEKYENQRWSISRGWSEKSLFFSDRWHWSSRDGKVDRSCVNLPSAAWQWEGDWMVDESVDRDIGDWKYAIDFPATFHNRKGKTSFVRRKKWIRYRKFHHFNNWQKIPDEVDLSYEAKDKDSSLEVVEEDVADPFHDITVGGYDVVGQVEGFLALWVVMVSGQVLFRTGVSRTCPKGDGWLPMDDTSSALEIVQLSCGPTGQVWGCTVQGNLVVRRGVTRKKITGSSWYELDCPYQNTIRQVAVGVNVVWALAKTNKVFFRRGITPDNEVGDKWVEMVGLFSFIYVAPNNQVFCISEDNKSIFVRTNVTQNEAVGREWKLVQFNITGGQAKKWLSLSGGACTVDHTAIENLRKVSVSSSSSIASLSSVDASRQVWRLDVLRQLTQRNAHETTDGQIVDGKYAIEHVVKWTKNEEGNLLLDTYYKTWVKCTLQLLPYDRGSFTFVVYCTYKGRYIDFTYPLSALKCAHRVCEPSHANTFTVQTHTNKSVVLSVESETMLEDWLRCLVSSENTDSSGGDFNVLSIDNNIEIKEVDSEIDSDTTGSNAIDMDNKITIEDKTHFQKTNVEEHKCADDIAEIVTTTLENNASSALDLSERHTKQNDDPTDLPPYTDKNKDNTVENSLLQQKKSAENLPLKKTMMGENLPLPDKIPVENQGINNPCEKVLWATTNLNEVFVCVCCDRHFLNVASARWQQVAGRCKRVCSGIAGVVWALGHNGEMFVYRPGRTYEQKCVETHYIYENKRWNPVEGYSDRLLPSDRWNWSDETGLHNCDKQKYHLSSKQERWTSEWEVDYNNKADKDGWQYAVDFPRHYHAEKTIYDYVRRRRWKRRYLVTTSGPWLGVPTDVIIRDVSVSPTHNAVWAVSCNGDVLVRCGVTKDNPQGINWSPVLVDIPALSISVGGKNNVWCLATDGSCYLRAGFPQAPFLGTHWLHVLKENMEFVQIHAGIYNVLAIDNKNTLYCRENVSDFYPEGTAWSPILENVTSVSVDEHDQVAIVQGGKMKIVRGDVKGEFCLVEILLHDWQNICIRSMEHSSTSNTKSTATDIPKLADSLNELTVEPVVENAKEMISENVKENVVDSEREPINPYTVDIYNLPKYIDLGD